MGRAATVAVLSVLSVTLLASCVGVSMVKTGSRSAREMLVADLKNARVLCINEEKGFEEPLWVWVLAQAEDMTEEQRALFPEMCECRPAVYQSQLVFLACSWPTGFAVVRMSDQKVLFVAIAPRNVHSAEVLPDGNLVAVSSIGGDAVRIYSTTTDETHDYPLPGGHGVVWDANRQCLWALGNAVLRRYSYDGNRDHPALALEATIELPQPGGHDLYPRARRDELFVTTADKGWAFQPETSRFVRLREFYHERANVKSVGEQSPSGRIAYTLWDDAIRLLNPEGKLVLPDSRIYKSRWNRLPEFTSR